MKIMQSAIRTTGGSPCRSSSGGSWRGSSWLLCLGAMKGSHTSVGYRGIHFPLLRYPQAQLWFVHLRLSSRPPPWAFPWTARGTLCHRDCGRHPWRATCREGAPMGSHHLKRVSTGVSRFLCPGAAHTQDVPAGHASSGWIPCSKVPENDATAWARRCHHRARQLGVHWPGHLVLH
jgi:hypothetical protein